MTVQLDIFFNTIDLKGQDLAEATNQAQKQDDRILEIMKRHKKLTPFEVSDIYNSLYPVAPVTSIRRSMTVLTDKGFLEMCDEMKKEVYGKPNHYWRLK